MRSTLPLRRIVRRVVKEALAISACALPLVACGSRSELLATDPDAESLPPLPAPPDAGAEASQDVDAADAAEADAGECVVKATGGCGSRAAVLSCIPAGFVLGSNGYTQCAPICGSGPGCTVEATSSGQYTVTCLCGGGRLPSDIESVSPAHGRDPLGVFLAQMGALESAAVRAFEQLARELTAHGAPAQLVSRARRAARDEVAHARLLRRAAAARGCGVPSVHYRRAPAVPRSILALAKDNAIEGCGRETLGAALLAVQGERAEGAALRWLFLRIAGDELAHAELAWELQAWLEGQLGEDERAEVSAARRAFLEESRTSRPPLDPHVARAIGWPPDIAWDALVVGVRDGVRALAA